MCVCTYYIGIGCNIGVMCSDIFYPLNRAKVFLDVNYYKLHAVGRYNYGAETLHDVGKSLRRYTRLQHKI